MSVRKALVVGIDNYPTAPLAGCVNDADNMHNILSKHADGSPNFFCKSMVGPPDTIDKSELKKGLLELFTDEVDIALFYFSGHGFLDQTGGVLVTQDAKEYDEGFSMQNVLGLANDSRAHEIVIILDCCFSGNLGKVPSFDNKISLLRDGISVLTACGAEQTAQESCGKGVFTALVYNALDGGASDVLGKVTAASIYAYVDQLLGPWEQRPLMKANIRRLASLRQCEPHVDLSLLRLLPEYFTSEDAEFQLDPSYEPEAEPRDEEHERIFGHLQEYQSARLLVPVGEKRMYFAAINSKSCQLTPIGQFYWRMAKESKI